MRIMPRIVEAATLSSGMQTISAGDSSRSSTVIECGFRDYSGFYKQYKKMFGFPPSKKIPK